MAIRNKKFKKIVWIFMLLILPTVAYCQKDVTQFLDIPVDGFKPEMIEKLKSKGFTITQDSEDIFEGEFNGTDVNLFIVTNNNKVWRIAVVDAYPTNETIIKIRFNTLIQQFVNNKRYSAEPDSTIAKFIIPKDEDIAYEIAVNKKRYEAVFYQKPIKQDSLTKERLLLLMKEELGDEEQDLMEQTFEKSGDSILKIFKETLEILNGLNKQVWFMIQEEYGKYRIVIYYDNEYNKANGEGL